MSTGDSSSLCPMGLPLPNSSCFPELLKFRGSCRTALCDSGCYLTQHQQGRRHLARTCVSCEVHSRLTCSHSLRLALMTLAVRLQTSRRLFRNFYLPLYGTYSEYVLVWLLVRQAFIDRDISVSPWHPYHCHTWSRPSTEMKSVPPTDGPAGSDEGTHDIILFCQMSLLSVSKLLFDFEATQREQCETSESLCLMTYSPPHMSSSEERLCVWPLQQSYDAAHTGKCEAETEVLVLDMSGKCGAVSVNYAVPACLLG